MGSYSLLNKSRLACAAAPAPATPRAGCDSKEDLSLPSNAPPNNSGAWKIPSTPQTAPASAPMLAARDDEPLPVDAAPSAALPPG